MMKLVINRSINNNKIDDVDLAHLVINDNWRMISAMIILDRGLTIMLVRYLLFNFP